MATVTLSYDNGPDAEVTPRVLDTLARHGARVTFFVIGERLAQADARRATERAHAEGHWIGNHTYTHRVPLGERTDPEDPEREIGATQRLLGALAHPDRLFRPFGGGALSRRLLSARARDYLIAGGYSCVVWNCVPRDWEDPGEWIETGLAQCAGQAWSLVVLHDFIAGAERMLDRFLGAPKDAGHEIVQALPPECVPIVRGRVVRRIEALVTV